ncbi:MAG TPA: HdeA/HdeB family chaperone [Stellaceae bacterium]|nr:HdeA/HdeB family chaperone [Stellaceae bacterium]
MRLTTGLIFGSLLCAASAAQADKLDLSTIKCQDFLKSSKDNIAVIITWLDAYYKDESAPPVIDFDKFTRNSKKLASYCAENPDTGLITAADKTLGAK